MWVQMKLSRGRREENGKEEEEPSMRQRRTGRGGKTRNKGVSGEVLFRSVKGNRANQVRMEEFPLAVTEPLVTLERGTPSKEHREVRQWGASFS